MINHKALWSPLHSSKLSGLGGLANRSNLLLLQSCTSCPALPHLKGQTDETPFQYNFGKFSCILFSTYTTDLSREDQRAHADQPRLCGTALHTLLHGHQSPDGACSHGFGKHGTQLCSDIRKVQKCSMVTQNHKSRALEVPPWWERKRWMFPPLLKADAKTRAVKNSDVLPALEGWSRLGRLRSCS